MQGQKSSLPGLRGDLEGEPGLLCLGFVLRFLGSGPGSSLIKSSSVFSISPCRQQAAHNHGCMLGPWMCTGALLSCAQEEGLVRHTHTQTTWKLDALASWYMMVSMYLCASTALFTPEVSVRLIQKRHPYTVN